MFIWIYRAPFIYRIYYAIFIARLQHEFGKPSLHVRPNFSGSNFYKGNNQITLLLLYNNGKYIFLNIISFIMVLKHL